MELLLLARNSLVNEVMAMGFDWVI